MSIRLVAIDRDGTLIRWVDHLANSSDLELLPGAAEAVAALNAAGISVALFTNQSVVARGLLSLESLGEIHAELRRMLATFDAHLDHELVCPHAEEDRCSCRKPSASLLLGLMAELEVDASEVAVIGDAPSDMGAARNAGVLGLRVLSGVQAEASSCAPEYADLASAVVSLLDDFASSGAQGGLQGE